MYYEEKLINGMWHYKTNPMAEFKPMSVELLHRKIDQLCDRLERTCQQ